MTTSALSHGRTCTRGGKDEEQILVVGMAQRVDTADEGELEKLANTYYNEHRYEVGAVIAVDDMYNQVKRLKQHKSEMEQTQKMLRMIADNLEVLTPIVAPEEADPGGKG